MTSLNALRPRRTLAAALLSCLLACLAPAPSRAQQTLNTAREQGRIMLGVLKADVQKNYYDPTFHGLDLEERFASAAEKLKAANSSGEINAVIGAALMSLQDSHTYYIPPPPSARIEHGWTMSMIGDRCYVTAVRPGSDAEAQGMRPGDRVVSVEGRSPSRANFWQMKYVLYLLAPRTAMSVAVEKPDGKRAYYAVKADVKQGRAVLDLLSVASSVRTDLIREAEMDARLHAHRYVEVGDEALIWKMPAFDLGEAQVDQMIERARKRKALVLDLRGNGGGAEATMLRLVGGLFDRDVQVGELKRRKESKPLLAKTRGSDAFKGRLVVLVDSDTASAAEVLARVVQLEKRGTVLGDKTSGSVRRGRSYDHQVGAGTIYLYGAVVTDAELLLSDGQSLEGVGVTPDELMLPQTADLASHKDPVLARAAELVGLQLSPEKAGAMFPVEWRK